MRVMALWLFLVGQLAHAVIIPDGWDDAPYVEFGKQYQTNLLSIRVFGTDPATGQIQYVRNASASYLNSRFALTAAHLFEGFPEGSQLTAEVATGSNTTNNRGIVMMVSKIVLHPLWDHSNPVVGLYTPDIAILCLASNLLGPKVEITNASVGEIVTEAGFGVHGSSSTGTTYDRNSRAWNAPVDGDIHFGDGAWSPVYYEATKFYPYISLNGKGSDRDSGGPVTSSSLKNAEKL